MFKAILHNFIYWGECLPESRCEKNERRMDLWNKWFVIDWGFSFRCHPHAKSSEEEKGPRTNRGQFLLIFFQCQTHDKRHIQKNHRASFAKKKETFNWMGQFALCSILSSNLLCFVMNGMLKRTCFLLSFCLTFLKSGQRKAMIYYYTERRTERISARKSENANNRIRSRCWSWNLIQRFTFSFLNFSISKLWTTEIEFQFSINSTIYFLLFRIIFGEFKTLWCHNNQYLNFMKQSMLSNSPQNKVFVFIQFSNRNNNRSALQVLKRLESLTCLMLANPPAGQKFIRNYFI